MDKDKTKQSNAGAYYLAGIGLAVAAVGVIFVYLMWGSFSKARETRRWVETPCLMIISTVKERAIKTHMKEYSWNLEYMYDFDGKSYLSKLDTLRGAKWSKTKDKIDEFIEEYPEGEKATCFVNPSNPEQAILKHDTKAAGYSIWFPMLFVVGGLGITISSLRGLKFGGIRC